MLCLALKNEILQRAVDLLSRREHSAKELANKLSVKGFSFDDIAPVIEYLQGKNYQSDERFSDSVLRSRMAKGYGWRYIQNELSQKGVSSSVIGDVLKNHQIDWYLQAELAYNKRFGETEFKDQKDKAKRIRFLQYRGFSTDEIMAAMKTN